MAGKREQCNLVLGHLDHHHQEMALAANFIATKAAQFHEAFGVASILNQSTMQYEPLEVYDLKETLECSQKKARRYLDFAHNLQECTWENVHSELRKAREKAEESEKRGRSGIKRLWRVTGATSSVLAPGLSAIPDSLCVLHGGLAVIFSLARHSEMNRIKILSGFESVPNIIEEAKNKSEKFPPNEKNPKTIQLHESVKELQETLLRVLPDLINRLIPGTWRNAWKSPFAGWNIDKLLDEVKHRAESVRVRAEALMSDIIVGNYATGMEIKSQIEDLRRQQDLMYMSIKATNSQTELLHFLLEQFASPLSGILSGRGLPEVANMGAALPGFIPNDLLMFMNVNHSQARHDSRIAIMRSSSFEPHDIEKASQMALAPEVTGLLGNPGPGVVAVDGHFDLTQMGKISPLSYVCSMTAQALRLRTPVIPSVDSPHSHSPISPQSDRGPARCVVLEYYCTLHMADNDTLYGPKGLVRCLTTQLILSMVENEWIFHEAPVHLPHLRDTEDAEELLNNGDLSAICNLLVGLLQLIPHGVSVYCIIDGWSVYERNEGLKVDYETVLDAFRDATSPQKFDAGASFKLLLTSPTMCRHLGEFLLPGQRVSLRSRDGGSSGGWRGVGKRRQGIFGMARAATMPDANSCGLQVGTGYASSHSSSGSAGAGDGYSRRSST
ncbi:hypothetical protein QBC44DRAFT_139558 [Cladorrhinum sp. PSN332]|nr:hypothetical protein QBC44DRAFT_139558 [Cladorrhinum sp. PSN332]